MDDELLTEAGQDLTLAGLVHTTGDEDLVILADGHGTDAVTGLEFLGEVGGHEGAAGFRVGCEVSLTGFAAGGGDGSGVLHFY